MTNKEASEILKTEWDINAEIFDTNFHEALDLAIKAFERMKLIQETVDSIRNTFNLDTESDKLVRNCMALVQNAIDGEYHDMEEVNVSEIDRPKGEYVDISKLRLMKVEECAGHTIDYAMGWKACVEWIKKGGAE